MGTIKETLRNTKKIIEWGQEQQYKKRRARKAENFEEWMRYRIASRKPEEAYRNAKPVEGNVNDFVVFSTEGGVLTKDAYSLIRKKFTEAPEMVLVYGDTDDKDGEEYAPWFLPCWSPDKFLAQFYFGNFFCIRKNVYDKWKKQSKLKIADVIREAKTDEVEKLLCLKGWEPVKPNKEGEYILRPGENDSYIMEDEVVTDLAKRSVLRFWYRMCFEILVSAGAFRKNGRNVVGNIPEIVFHRESLLDVFRLDDVGPLHFQGISQDEIEQLIFENDGLNKNENEKLKQELTISVVIPSKDNPVVLERCIRSVLEETAYGEGEYIKKLEIVVVDNGSKEENRSRLERLSQELGFAYYYEPLEFNFSIMCNLGVAKSTGNYILLLNDDMEVIQSNWLEELAKKARMPYAGAVGAKLLYPDSSYIQHAGITNIRLGPTHKLQKMSDEDTYYFGQNRRVQNMIAVTGACLLVKRQIYEELGGLQESLRVAFNDVDFCFSLFEMGYSNIQRNDVILYHHESLSRGNDNEDEAKIKRLNREMEHLFERHPALFAEDPYYSQYLTSDVSDVGYTYYFSLDFNHEYQIARPEPLKRSLANAREDSCLNCGVEFHHKLGRWLGKNRTKTPEDGYLQGYSFVIGSNNACYQTSILLESEQGELFEIIVEGQFRPDIAKNVPDQKNVEMSGFSIQIPVDALKKGRYRIGLYAKKKLAKEEIIRWTTCYLEM